MSRLIDADALERDGWQMSRTVRISKDEMELQIRKPTDFPAIEDAPTIEPQRMKGTWYRSKEWQTKTYKRLCTNCQDVAYYCGTGDYKFCPNCGADMRGEQDETD